MAVLTAPLFSFAASGKLAGALVYSRWKGLNDVRKYVIPANPQSSGQVSQRSKFSSAVDDWHTLALTATDIEAWDRAAANAAKPQSGFNKFVGYLINLFVAGLPQGDEDMGFNGDITDSGTGQVDMTVEEDGDATSVTFHWGFTPTALIQDAAGAETANVWNALNVAAPSGSTVYMQAEIFKAGPTLIGSTGIYRFGPVT